MAYKREETKKKKCFKAFSKINKSIEDRKGIIYFIFFIIMLAIIPVSSESLSIYIKSLEIDTLTTIIRYVFSFTFITSYLKMLIKEVKKDEKN